MSDERRLADRLEAMDRETLAWAKLTRRKLLDRLLQLGVEDKIKLSRTVSRFRRTKSGKTAKDPFLTKSVSKYLRKRNGEIESVGFSFVRHGIFLEHGVGKGRPVGSSRANKHAKKWLSYVLPEAVEGLADMLEGEYADIAAAELKFIIPGVINTTISGQEKVIKTNVDGRDVGVVIDPSFF